MTGEPEATKLVEGVHHLTFLTEDIDRLVDFYERVFETRKSLDMTEEGVRHVFLEIGPTTVLHPFQILEGPALPSAPGTMFQRGRLDHFAFLARRGRPFSSFAVASSRKTRPTEGSVT